MKTSIKEELMELKITEQQKKSIKYMTSMMESCFAYGGIDKDSYNFERYLSEYKGELGEQLFALTYMTKKQDLEQNYEVLNMTSQDGEGNWYNTLKKK